MKQNFGLILPTGFKMDLPQNSPYETLERITLSAEELGFNSIWSFDHILSHPDSSYPILEPWSVLAALATRTKKIRMGTLVTCAPFRHPAVLAKIAATADLLSSGRIELGIGAGWYEKEFVQFGIDGFQARASLFEEYIQILTSLLEGKEVNFVGKHYRLTQARIVPSSTQRPSIPLWVGATRPRMLRAIARYASRWNMRGTPEYFESETRALTTFLEREGRSINDIEKSIYCWIHVAPNRESLEVDRISTTHQSPQGAWPERIKKAAKNPQLVEDYIRRRTGRRRMSDPLASDITGTAEECVSRLGEYVDLGVSNFFLYVVGLEKPETLEFFRDQVAAKV
jgi:alkanesulfonate monooxygenase SsuD/methylene tetrahydromethanopterin reductase-like flavin-dependent oxidoreductase (luciferase family)